MCANVQRELLLQREVARDLLLQQLHKKPNTFQLIAMWSVILSEHLLS